MALSFCSNFQRCSAMTKAAKGFLKSTTTKMDEILAALTPEEQHDLLDALAGEVEERLDQLIDTED
jgi:hypothetical protein